MYCSVSGHPEDMHIFIDGKYLAVKLHRSVMYIYIFPSCPLW